jgi:hypothetical protein
LEHQYVLYAAATSSTLVELLTDWRPWLPDLDWSDMSLEVPVLADAIVELVNQGRVELFYGEPDGELGSVSPADVPDVVHDLRTWWNEERVPRTELLLTPQAGGVGVPERRTSRTSG